MAIAPILCDVLDNQRNLTKWYLKKVPLTDFRERIEINGKFLNSPLWVVGHLIWTDFYIGLNPLGYSSDEPEWLKEVGFGSSGEIPSKMPDAAEAMAYMNEVHQTKIDFIRTLDDTILKAPYALTTLGFKSNYYALLHLARHEGVHLGGIAAFLKFKGIKTV